VSPPHEARSREGHVEILTRNWILLGFVLAVGLTGAVLLAPGVPHTIGPFHDVEVFAWLPLLWGVIIGPVLVSRNSFPKRTPCTLRADADGLSLDGVLALPRARIEDGYLQPAVDGRCVVRVRGRGARGMTFVTGRDTATAILDALGLGVAGHTARVSGLSPLALWYVGPLPLFPTLLPVLFVAALLFAGFVNIVPQIALLAIPMLWILSRIPSRIEVGADGVLRSWLGLRRFIPFRDVASVAGRARGGPITRPLRDREDVVLLKLDGRRVALGARNRFDAEAQQGADDAALLHRVQEAFEAFRARGSPADATAMLARGSRGVGEWVAQIRALCATQGTGYRGSALSQERLLRVVEDPAAEPSLRAGAAVALAQAPGEGWRGELRRAADACANPRVRVVLETVAKGAPEEQWIHTLEGLDDASASPRARASS
jgi:hypothetical protein